MKKIEVLGMIRERQRRTKIIVLLVGIMLLMSVGYAAFQTNLQINGTGGISSAWDIEITNVTEGTKTGSAKTTVTEGVTNPSWNALTANMEADLYHVGDSITYDVTIANKGTVDAVLSDITKNIVTSDEALEITFSGFSKGQRLYRYGQSNSTITIGVTITYVKDTGETDVSAETSVTFNFKQATGGGSGPSAPDTYLVTYDCSTNGGRTCPEYNEYVAQGSSVDLSKSDNSKTGYEFVGWNTNSSATTGLSSLTMGQSNITLYAIYQKTITLTYDKNNNAIVLGKENDICNVFNNNTTCTVTLPTITISDPSLAEIKGWYDGDTKVGDSGDSYTASSSATLTAKVDVAPMIKKWPGPYDSGTTEVDFHAAAYRTKITSIEFVTSNEVPDEAIESWDVSALENSGAVMAWVLSDGNGGYELYIGGEDGVIANSDNSSWLFYNFTALTSIDFNNFDLSEADEIYGLLANCTSLTSVDLRPLDTHNITQLGGLFENCSSLTSVNLSTMNTSKATSMKNMFLGCSSLTSLDLGNFNTSNVTDISNMFNDAASLTHLNVSNFNTSNVTNMEAAFYNCSSLTSLDLGNWNTSKVTNMQSLFYKCSNLTSLDLGNFDTSRVTMFNGMFRNMTNLTTIYVSDDFVTTASNTETGMMFADSPLIVGGNGTAVATKQVYDKTYAKIDKAGQEGYFTDGTLLTINGINFSTTTNSITAVVSASVASSSSTITKYEFSIDGGATWIDNGTNNTYTFTGLNPSGGATYSCPSGYPYSIGSGSSMKCYSSRSNATETPLCTYTINNHCYGDRINKEFDVYHDGEFEDITMAECEDFYPGDECEYCDVDGTLSGDYCYYEMTEYTCSSGVKSGQYCYSGETNAVQEGTYTVSVRVTTNKGKQATASDNVVISSIDSPTFSETSAVGQKTVTITYPSYQGKTCSTGLTCQYSTDGGTTWTTVTTNTQAVNFTNNGNVVAKIGYQSSEASSSYSVTFTKIESPTTSLCAARTYTGAVQQITSETSGTGYTLSGYSATTAGAHTVTASLQPGYLWTDDTSSNKTFSCSISKATPTITLSASSGIIATGKTRTFTATVKSGAASGTVSGTLNVTSGSTSIATISPNGNTSISNANASTGVATTETITGAAKGASTITVKFTPTDTTNYNSATNKTYAANVRTAVTVPSCTSRTYTGAAQTLIATGTGYTLSNNSRTAAGSQDVTLAISDTATYAWTDNTQANKTKSCSIAKRTPTITLSASSGTIYYHETATFTATVKSAASSGKVSGTLNVTSGSTSIATVTPNGNTTISNADASTGVATTVTVKGQGAGSATVTVKFTPSDTTNYNSATNKTYTVTGKKEANCVKGKEFTYSYTGGMQSFTAPCKGTYTLEVYGAQGGGCGSCATGNVGGKGGYAKGTVTLTRGTVVYIGVGGRPTTNAGGYNGGGAPSNNGSSTVYAGGGGGATHMGKSNAVLKSTTKANVYIVGGGGGGAANSGAGGTGGNTNGGAGTGKYYGKGGTQSAGGQPTLAAASEYGSHTSEYNWDVANCPGKYGQGGAGGKLFDAGCDRSYGGGGGGGLYGGAGGDFGCTQANSGSGGGGSGYTGGVSGGTMTSGSRSGNGYAKITLTTVS